MATVRFEIRDLCGKPLPGFCDDFDDPQLPVDHSELARHTLKMVRESGELTAYSVHFLREGQEIGSWSLHRDRFEATAF
jgi:hypothetical protein